MKINLTEKVMLSMPAGAELDTILAKYVMGWKEIRKAIEYNNSIGVCYTVQDDGVWKFQPGLAHLWQPSKEIHDTWDLTSIVSRAGFNIRIEIQDETRVTFWSKRMNEYGPYPISAKAMTVPLAICRCVLFLYNSK